MYCSQCGRPATGNFCSDCGAPLAIKRIDPPALPLHGWHREVRYETLLRVPEVQSAIQRHASQARHGLTGEQLLKLFDVVSPVNVSLETVVMIAQPIYAKLGIKTGKQHAANIQAPVGKVIVRTLCSLARNNQALRNVRQGTDGCVLEAVLPSDVWSLEGELLVSIAIHDQGTQVDAATTIKGQLYDWGKSRRRLERLFADLQADAA